MASTAASASEQDSSTSGHNVPIFNRSHSDDDGHSHHHGHGFHHGPRFSFPPPPPPPFSSPHSSPWMYGRFFGSPFAGPPPRGPFGSSPRDMGSPSPPPPPPTPGPPPRQVPSTPSSAGDLENHNRCPFDWSSGGNFGGGFDPRFGSRSRFHDPRFFHHGMHDDPRVFHHGMPHHDPRGFGDHYHHPDFWGFPHHPSRPFSPGPFGPPPPPEHVTDLHHDHHHCPYITNWWSMAQTCPWIRRSVPTPTDCDKDFQFTIDVSQFTPDDLNVTVVDGHVRIEGAHDERNEEGGLIRREFTRRYPLPDDVDPSAVKSEFGDGGLLSVFAAARKPEGGADAAAASSDESTTKKDAQQDA